MLTQNNRDDINSQWKRISLLWFILFVSMGISAGIIYYIGRSVDFTPTPLENNSIKMIFYVFSIAQFFVLMAMRRNYLMHLKGNIADGSNGASSRGDKARLFLLRYRKIIVVCGGLSESFVVYGAILYFLYQDLNSYVILLTLSILSFYVSRPRLNEVKRVFLPKS